MAKKDRVHLNRDKVLAAIAADFSQYGIQKRLYSDLGRLIFGANAGYAADLSRNGIWISGHGNNRMRFVSFEALGDLLIEALRKDTVSLEFLARVTGRIFRTRAYPGRNDKTKEEGIWVETGMENFKCRQCGKCCRVLDYRDEFTGSDYQRLAAAGRTDVLQWVSVTQRKGKEVRYRIWIKPGTTQYAHVCPWLRKPPDQNRYVCLIQDVKPEICREYPKTRKHAQKTGCQGFE